jgi:hypothetical protein
MSLFLVEHPSGVEPNVLHGISKSRRHMTPSQFRQALETLAFIDGSRMALQLTSGQTISGRFQTMLNNGDMVWFTEERTTEERQTLIDVTQVAAVAEPWRDAVLSVGNDTPPVKQQGAEVRSPNI